MKIQFVLSVFLLLSTINRSSSSAPFVTQQLVDDINRVAVNWIADVNEGSTIAGASLEEIKGLLGVLPGGPKLPIKKYEATALPDSFDSATNWPFCPTITEIRDQSACGSCWAFGAVEAMSDRMCISLKKNVSLSSADLAFCCDDCGFGCGGGYPASAWQFWVDNGIVEEGCWAYPFPSCDHHVPGSPHPCPADEYSNPPCPNKCSATWTGPAWNSNMHKGKSAYSLRGETDIMTEIFQNGPVETAFTVYSDFVTYKSGVYRHTSGSPLGGHAVRIVGWGVLNGEKYWKIANSWNPTWGDHGYFLILKGTNECGIEDEVSAGIPAN